ncbi:MAG: MOSC domain-containing protein [Burkholderiales bacterium]
MKIHSLNISNGGVPKLSVASCDVRASGLVGDRQRDRRYHGGPERAVSLYSLELIRALAAEGHAVVPGALGENLTLEGLDWTQMTPGAVLEAGPVVLELTSYAAPCNNLRRYFCDGRFARVSQKTHPGWSRLYARVLRAGRLAAGDPVRLPRPFPSNLQI